MYCANNANMPSTYFKNCLVHFIVVISVLLSLIVRAIFDLNMCGQINCFPTSVDVVVIAIYALCMCVRACAS